MLEREGELVRGELRPGGTEREWCDPEVLRRLRRASLAVLRKEVEPVDQPRARAIPAGLAGRRSPSEPSGAGVDRLREVLVPLQGLALPADVWERDVLPRRVGAYSPAWMDQLCASGELVWIGAGALGRDSGRVALYFREDLADARAAAAARRRGRRRPTSSTTTWSASEARGAGRVSSADLLVDARDSRPSSSRRRCGISSGPVRLTNDAFAPLRAPRLTLARASTRALAGLAAPGGPVRGPAAAAAPTRRFRAAGH